MAVKGRKQTPEHIAKRVESIRKTKAEWTEERYRLFCDRSSASLAGYCKASSERAGTG
jgi:hypothetical protein